MCAFEVNRFGHGVRRPDGGQVHTGSRSRPRDRAPPRRVLPDPDNRRRTDAPSHSGSRFPTAPDAFRTTEGMTPATKESPCARPSQSPPSRSRPPPSRC
ncbi:protein of unknown function [Blastococcus saxobsidens DD2]|uniref:Uncharacterized protein n=1 Tax=Blastococcus saxobsidens (strain DD2) TaxID=1146883 RepID=H6RR33_BLASD|nr:protein of unknown function [Blastococcus saxobsidens DD2]